MTMVWICIQFLACAAVTERLAPSCPEAPISSPIRLASPGTDWPNTPRNSHFAARARTGITAVTGAGIPTIAVGDVLGSCVFNLAILVVVDFIFRQSSERGSQGHLLSAGFGIVLIGMVALSLILTAECRRQSVMSASTRRPLSFSISWPPGRCWSMSETIVRRSWAALLIAIPVSLSRRDPAIFLRCS